MSKVKIGKLIMIVVLVLIPLYKLSSEVYKNYQLKEEIAEIERQIEQLQLDAEKYSDPEFIEMCARERLNATEQGEVVFEFPENDEIPGC